MPYSIFKLCAKKIYFKPATPHPWNPLPQTITREVANSPVPQLLAETAPISSTDSDSVVTPPSPPPNRRGRSRRKAQSQPTVKAREVKPRRARIKRVVSPIELSSSDVSMQDGMCR